MANSASASDRNDLKEFLDDTRSVIRQIVDARHVLFREDVRQLFVDSWAEVEPEIESAMTLLQTSGAPLEKRLGEAGLSGKQLKLKLTTFRRLLDQYKKRGTLTLLTKLLKSINRILGSLISAMPGAEPIKEFKEAIEEELDDSDFG